MIAKIVEARQPAIPEVERPTVYELFEIQTIKDIDNNDVQIPRSIGRYTLEQLEAEKANIQKKIDTINSIKGE